MKYPFLCLSMILFFLMMSSCNKQNANSDRVTNAYEEKEAYLKQVLEEKNISWEQPRIFLRAFKEERILEVWAKNLGDPQFQQVLQYDFCRFSGKLGPKRKEGDRQIPEGFYVIDRFNPKSSFHLSLGLNYPNQSDKILGDPKRPGSDIFIHGACSTVGCIPITDDKIKELYILAKQAKEGGQDAIVVHIFPSHLNDENYQRLISNFPQYADFWKGLQNGYQYFEDRHHLPVVRIDEAGNYKIN